MIRKTQQNFQRRVRSWPLGGPTGYHNEKVLRETWWLFWVIPIYSRETITATNL